eukprot:3661593-Pyramimonas_sp.AAC.1
MLLRAVGPPSWLLKITPPPPTPVPAPPSDEQRAPIGDVTIGGHVSIGYWLLRGVQRGRGLRHRL